jgi:molybdate transport system permease protein
MPADLFPVWHSLPVAVVATVLTVVVGLPVAWLVSRHHAGRPLVTALVLSPLVMPPTVLVYYLLVLIGSRGPLGRALGALGLGLAFTWWTAALAACVGSLPLLIRAAQAGFESVDERLEQAARTLGRSEASVFWSVSLPLARRSIAAGIVLAFCRALVDVGITLMIAGSIPVRY